MINQTATSSFLAALATLSTSSHNGQPVVSRPEALEAHRQSNPTLPEPRWLMNDASPFAVGRSQFRIPTLAECEQYDRGYRAGAPRGRKPSGVKQAKPRVAPEHSARSARVVSAPAPAPAPSIDMKVLVRDDAANTDIQRSASEALGVAVLLGSSDSIPYVPQVLPTYVPWGHFSDLRTLISSSHFLPVMIVGPSGNGKTEMCEQVCATLGREYVRVNITTQTDEDDLLGGFRLINGETKFSLGPIPLAMLRGAVVNLDEIDLGGPSMMCLQPVLEGKPLYLKKIGRYITPAPGFTIVATANTKGRGDDGKYAHTTIMNEAMLERFAIMLEQGWPDAQTERSILKHILKSHGKYDGPLVKDLVHFAGVTRTNFEQQVCNDQIATRRLIHMARVFCALGNIDQAIAHTLARFDADTATAFTNLWKAIHEAAPAASSSGASVPVEATDDIPF